jgi:hypothetical protein
MNNRLQTILETVSEIINESNRARRALTKGKKDIAAIKQNAAIVDYMLRGYRKAGTPEPPKPGPKKYFGSQVERRHRRDEKIQDRIAADRIKDNIAKGMSPEQAASEVASYMSRGT